MTTDNLAADITRDEGRERSAYQDSRGYWTIGVGHLIDGRRGGGISDAIIDAILQEDVAAKKAQLTDQIPWWTTLDDVRQDALVNMAFNLGVDGLLQFEHFLGALHAGDYASAAASMMQSLWAKQVGQRAVRLHDMILTGKPS